MMSNSELDGDCLPGSRSSFRTWEFMIHSGMSFAALGNFLFLLVFVQWYRSTESELLLFVLLISTPLHLFGILLRRPHFLMPNIVVKILMTVYLTMASFSLQKFPELQYDTMSCMLWSTLTIMWFIVETCTMITLYVRMCLKSRKTSLHHQNNGNDDDSPPNYSEVMSVQRSENKRQPPSYAEYLVLYGHRCPSTPCTIDVEKLEQCVDLKANATRTAPTNDGTKES